MLQGKILIYVTVKPILTYCTFVPRLRSITDFSINSNGKSFPPPSLNTSLNFNKFRLVKSTKRPVSLVHLAN